MAAHTSSCALIALWLAFVFLSVCLLANLIPQSCFLRHHPTKYQPISNGTANLELHQHEAPARVLDTSTYYNPSLHGSTLWDNSFNETSLAAQLKNGAPARVLDTSTYYNPSLHGSTLWDSSFNETSLAAQLDNGEFATYPGNEDVLAAIAHCFKKRNIMGPQKTYLHSGSAAAYHGADRQFNDIDLFVPTMDASKKNSLGATYTEAVPPEYKTVGLTDKGKEENNLQVYCPKDAGHLEVDAWVGKGGNLDQAPFAGFATYAIENAKKIGDADGLELYSITEVDLIMLKCMLVLGGRGGDGTEGSPFGNKQSDWEDIKFLLTKGIELPGAETVGLATEGGVGQEVWFAGDKPIKSTLRDMLA